MTDHTNPNHTDHSVSQAILNIGLVMVETLLTLLLRFDANLRQAVYPLANQGILICVRTYIPHITFYVTFSYHGILLDGQKPEKKSVDVTMNVFTWQLAQAILSNDIQVIQKLQMRGESHHVELVQQFLLTVGIGSAVQNLLKRVKGKKSQSPTKDQPNKLQQYKQRIDEQQNKINQLIIQQAQTTTALQELKSKNRWLVGLLIGCVMVIMGLSIGLFWN